VASRITPAGLQVLGTPIPIGFGNGVPGGCIGYAKKTADQSGITSQVAISSLSVAVTVNASRLIWVRLWIGAVAFSDTTTYGRIHLLEGGNTLAYGQTGQTIAGVGSEPPVVVEVLLVAPSTGSHTYSAAASRLAGSGTLTVACDADRASFIQVIDLGPSF
jgi:hypothetical protein